MTAAPVVAHVERVPSGWNLHSMELEPFEPHTLDIFDTITNDQVLIFFRRTFKSICIRYL